jgi:hypothetical protein
LKNSAKKLFEFLKFLKNSEKTSFNLKILENNQLSTFPYMKRKKILKKLKNYLPIQKNPQILLTILESDMFPL